MMKGFTIYKNTKDGLLRFSETGEAKYLNELADTNFYTLKEVKEIIDTTVKLNKVFDEILTDYIKKQEVKK